MSQSNAKGPRHVVTGLLTMFCLLMMVTVQAQEKQVKGSVKDSKGDPVQGASVAIKGTQTAVAADANGSFSITAKSGDVLSITAVSFTSTEVKVGSASSYDVVMTSNTATLSDVVVVGYGRASRKNLTSSITSISFTANS